MADLATLTALSTAVWDETKPSGTRDVNLGDDDIREFKGQIRERLGVDHNIVSDETGIDNLGAHKAVHLITQATPSSVTDVGIIYAKDVSGKAEAHYLDEDDNEIQLTKAGVINAFPFVTDGTEGQFIKRGASAPAYADVSRAVVFYVDGEFEAGTSKSAKIRVPFAGTITRVDAYVDTAPTGADIIVDVNKNGTSIWASTQANRVTITASGTSGNQTSFDTTAVAAGDTFTIDLDQVGSTVAGADITIIITIKEL